MIGQSACSGNSARAADRVGQGAHGKGRPQVGGDPVQGGPADRWPIGGGPAVAGADLAGRRRLCQRGCGAARRPWS
ncbi:MAG: hypothetical protein MZW92_27055 [Comamonadaceae bacterium]|nr:hypothetical protein [Comamonadaceae bacterium]